MFPRLNLETGEVIPADTRFRIGDEFARVDPPHPENTNPHFHTWRLVKWRVVRVQHKHWNVDTEQYDVKWTTAFRVVGEVPLEAEEIEFWQAYARV